MTHEHVEDRAALFALGALDDAERATVETHLRVCTACARAVAAAEADVALVASMEARHEAPPDLEDRIDGMLRPNRALIRRTERTVWAIPAALAAVLILGLLPSVSLWMENRRLHDAMLVQSAAMDRIAAGSHRMARFQSTGASLGADVMYAPDGSWYVVVVRNARKSLQVAWMHAGERTMLGSAVPLGDVAMLYLPKSHRMDRLALMDGDRIVAEASLSWRRTPPSRPGARFG
ncbi:MAG: zf-HC2 domain-containing protein [Candidatus Cybelea sp.]